MAIWTAKDRQRLADWRAMGDSVAEMAARLGRSVETVRVAIFRFGLSDPVRVWGEAESAELTRLHALGLSDHEIAGRMGWSIASASRHRRMLGLPSLLSAVLSRQAKERGLNSRRVERWKAVCASRGWPMAHSPQSCDVLDVLERLYRATTRRVRLELRLSEGAASERLRDMSRRGLVVACGRRDGFHLWELADGVQRVVKKEYRGSGRKSERVLSFGI